MDVYPEATQLVRNRISVAAILGAIAFTMIGARLVDLTIFNARDNSAVAASQAATNGGRADLVDRNGALIARDLPVSDLYATPANFWDIEEAARGLATATGADVDRLREVFAPKDGYVLVARALTPDARAEVMRLGLPGLFFEEGRKRFYPNGRVVSHVIGQVDADGNGVSGLELGLDEMLRTSHDPVAVSLDMRVQFALRREVEATMHSFQAKAAGGIVIDVHTGEILAMVSLPDYEPNSRVLGDGDSIRNRMTQDVYELGSIFKIFAFAEAVDEETIRLDERFVIDRPLRFGRYSIGDYGRHGHDLSAAYVFAESSNIGTAQIGLRSGAERQQAFLQKLGLLSPLRTEVPEMASPLYPRRWNEIETATISYGHGISVNPLSFVAAAASVTNGGTKLTPSFLKDPEVAPGERVISEDASLTMRALLRLAVTDGTGGFADVPGYFVGGKTGTAEKPTARGYSSRLQITSFAGIFPAQDPKYLVFTMFDEPIGNAQSHGFATAGWTAAPATGRVIARIAPLLGVPYETEEPESAYLAVSAEMAAATP
jgi:cell division protein FtsI (penicillin-binding protein 3)